MKIVNVASNVQELLIVMRHGQEDILDIVLYMEEPHQTSDGVKLLL
jgi:hypothetical protein